MHNPRPQKYTVVNQYLTSNKPTRLQSTGFLEVKHPPSSIALTTTLARHFDVSRTWRLTHYNQEMLGKIEALLLGDCS